MKIEEIEKAIDAIKSKLDIAKKEYAEEKFEYERGLRSRLFLEYKRGVYDGVERAWREVVFLQTELEKESE